MTDSAKKPTGNKLEILFYKYEPMVYRYANKLYDVGALGMDKDDILQELRVKLYTSMLGYLKRWKEYRTTGRRKPVSMYHYLQCCMGNHVTDFITKIRRIQEVFKKNSLETESYDYGVQQSNTSIIDLGAAKVAVLNGVDLLQGLSGDSLAIWMLHLKGYTSLEIERLLHTRMERLNIEPHWVKSVITHQRKRLAKYAETLRQEPDELYTVQCFVEE